MYCKLANLNSIITLCGFNLSLKVCNAEYIIPMEWHVPNEIVFIIPAKHTHTQAHTQAHTCPKEVSLGLGNYLKIYYTNFAQSIPLTISCKVKFRSVSPDCVSWLSLLSKFTDFKVNFISAWDRLQTLQHVDGQQATIFH